MPQIQAYKLNSNWDFIVLATDGVWDAMTNQEMITFIKGRLGSPDRPNNAATAASHVSNIYDLVGTTFTL